ncbi:MAG TPA: response regulator [Tepidisphaeraceae bacterium]|jgi:two-component system response regulator RegA
MQEIPQPAPLPTILIVDDNEPTAKALAKVLRSANFNTAVTFRGADAIEYAANNPIAAAVVDIHLPDLNGLVVTQKLRERLGPATPIIILSGDTSMETLNSLPQVGATYFFSKPVNATELVARMHEWVDGNDRIRNLNDPSTSSGQANQ